MSRAGVAVAPLVEHRSARIDHARFEWAMGGLRFAAALGIVSLGQAMPNVGGIFVVVLAIFFAGYGLVVALAWARARTWSDRQQASRVTLAADISLVGFALFVFAPDPSWTVYAFGFIAIASGGVRFRSGALLAAASLSLTYVIVMVFRTVQLGIPSSPAIVVLHLAGYLAAGGLLDTVLPELDALRQRELVTYEPILKAQEAAGEAVLMTDAGRPVYWNLAFESLTGFVRDDHARPPDLADLIVGAGGEVEGGAFEAQLRTRAGDLVDVEVVEQLAVPGAGERRVWLFRDVTSRRRADAELREQALHDPLTGLPNRLLLNDRLASAVAMAQRQNTPVSLLLLDLDGFKAVNDVHGHHAGDLVLVEIANRLRGTLRESDTAARLGGDEFVLMLPATPLVGAVEASRALVDFIGAPVNVEGTPVTVGASIGIAVFPQHGRDAEDLLAAADTAMYEAKRSGGGYRAFLANVGASQP